MNKYKKLAINTFIFAVGSFGAKTLSLLMTNLYTKNMSPTDFYGKNLLETTAWFLLPVFTFSMTEAIVRFGLDKNYSKKSVFSTASVVTLSGLLLMLVILPSIMLLPFLHSVRKYTIYLIFYILASALRSLCSQFVRAREKLKLFSFDGILTTFMLSVFNIILISKLHMGITGFLIASVLADCFSAVFLFISANLIQYTSIKAFDSVLAKEMLRFTIPIIPTIVMWTAIVYADQIFIGNMKSDIAELGESQAGLYAAAAKIPNLISIVSSIFFQAWNMSAIKESDSADRNVFYEKVYRAYESMIFICSAGLILIVQPVSLLLINHSSYTEYSMAYFYTPLLITASVFNCFNDFLFSIYTVTKHPVNAFYTGFAAFVVNMILNYTLIPVWGIQGAALATFLSHLFCYALRMIDARFYIPFKVNPFRTVFNTLALLVMCFVSVFYSEYRLIPNLIITLGVCIYNSKELLKTADRILKRK